MKSLKNNEQGKDTTAVYLDLSKAFDTLDHDQLLKKLERYGIRGDALKWYTNYLTNRKLRVKCSTTEGTTYSDLYDCDYGTPQGSCLGPLLFLIFTNDVHLHLEFCNCLLFANDTTIYLSHKNKKYREWCIQEDLKTLQDWFQANKLILNLSKTVCMQFQNKKVDQHCHIDIDGYSLPVVTSTKFLGIWIDNKLKWQTHFDRLCLKIIRNTNLLKLCKNEINMCTKKLIYYAHIYSHLVYGCTTWGNMLRKEQIQKLQKLQNICLYYITNRRVTVSTYQEHKILRISSIIKLQNLKLGYKMQHSQLPKPVLEACTADSNKKTLVKKHHYNTRCKRELNHPAPKSKWYKNSFLVKSLTQYQSLPYEVRKIDHFQSFVSSCKKLLLDY